MNKLGPEHTVAKWKWLGVGWGFEDEITMIQQKAHTTTMIWFYKMATRLCSDDSAVKVDLFFVLEKMGREWEDAWERDRPRARFLQELDAFYAGDLLR